MDVFLIVVIDQDIPYRHYFEKTFCATNTQKKQFTLVFNLHTKKGVGTLTYYLVEALLLLRVLDCPSCIISKAHTKIVYSLPYEG